MRKSRSRFMVQHCLQELEAQAEAFRQGCSLGCLLLLTAYATAGARLDKALIEAIENTGTGPLYSKRYLRWVKIRRFPGSEAVDKSLQASRLQYSEALRSERSVCPGSPAWSVNYPLLSQKHPRQDCNLRPSFSVLLTVQEKKEY